MSVIARDHETKKVYLFSKGAPEKINTLCLNSPTDFQENLTRLALQGFRVLALACREINISVIQNDRSELE